MEFTLADSWPPSGGVIATGVAASCVKIRRLDRASPYRQKKITRGAFCLKRRLNRNYHPAKTDGAAMFPPNTCWTRRDFLRVVGGAGLISAVPTLASTAAALDSDTVCISILHTTDLHGHILPASDYDGNPDRGGLARCATQIRRWRRQNKNSILIDAGDVYQGTDVSFRNQGQLMIDLFNHLEYDAWILGNHEFDWGIEPFQQALARSPPHNARRPFAGRQAAPALSVAPRPDRMRSVEFCWAPA